MTPKKKSNGAQDNAAEQEADADSSDGSSETPAASGGKGMYFEDDGLRWRWIMDMAPIADALGSREESIFEEPSCAAQGTAYLYTYPDLDNTYRTEKIIM